MTIHHQYHESEEKKQKFLIQYVEKKIKEIDKALEDFKQENETGLQKVGYMKSVDGRKVFSESEPPINPETWKPVFVKKGAA